MNADEIIAILGMRPHPEGGHYVETFVDSVTEDSRACSTAIYYLLQRGERSHWHRVDAAEVWLWHAGATLTLRLSEDGVSQRTIALGTDLPAGERPQGVVERGVWQAAESAGDWTLVSCTVAPGFRFEGFEMAPAGWEPGSNCK